MCVCDWRCVCLMCVGLVCVACVLGCVLGGCDVGVYVGHVLHWMCVSLCCVCVYCVCVVCAVIIVAQLDLGWSSPTFWGVWWVWGGDGIGVGFTHSFSGQPEQQYNCTENCLPKLHVQLVFVPGFQLLPTTIL